MGGVVYRELYRRDDRTYDKLVIGPSSNEWKGNSSLIEYARKWLNDHGMSTTKLDRLEKQYVTEPRVAWEKTFLNLQ